MISPYQHVIDLHPHFIGYEMGICHENQRFTVGFNSLKGSHFAVICGKRVFSLGRDAAANEALKEIKAFKAKKLVKGIQHAIKARVLGTFDFAQYAAFGSIGFTIHGLSTIGGGLATAITSPLYFNGGKERTIFRTCLGFTKINAVSTIMDFGGLILSPIETVAPELNFKVLKTYRWGSNQHEVKE